MIYHLSSQQRCTHGFLQWFHSIHQEFPDHFRIPSQATSYIEGGNIQAVIDPSLEGDFELQSIWKIAEIAILCVKPQGMQRPSISLVLKEIQEAIAIEQSSGVADDCPMTGNSPGSSLNLDSVALTGSEAQRDASFLKVFSQPVLRWW